METKLKLSKKEGCLFDDRILIEVSPAQVEYLINLAEKSALEEKNYNSQGIIRKLKDVLQDAFDYWRRERNKIDKKEA